MRRAIVPPAFLGLIWALSACSADDAQAPDQGGMPDPGTRCASPAQGRPEDIDKALAACGKVRADTPHRDLDLLFVIDNYGSAGVRLVKPKQRALAEALPDLLQRLAAPQLSLHAGVVSSDVGTWKAKDTPWDEALPNCDSYAGDDGALQAVPCSSRAGLSDEAAQDCMDLCPDPSFAPQDGSPFLAVAPGRSNVPKALQGEKDQGPGRALQCLALLGDTGCALTAPFESLKRALDGHNDKNQGFLRPGSVLALVLLADKEDCSVSLGRRADNDPLPRLDCQAPDKNAQKGCFNYSYRCYVESLDCDEPWNTVGAKHNCKERLSYLEPVDTYAGFLKTLRPAQRLLLLGLFSPSLDKGAPVISYQANTVTPTSRFLNLGIEKQGACYNAQDPTIFGRPQLRLSKLARQFPGATEANACATDGYKKALGDLGDALRQKLAAAPACLGLQPKTLGDRPLCLVGDVDAAMPDAVPPVAFPLCSAGCCRAFAESKDPRPEDPAVTAACQGEAADACYCAVPSLQAGVCPGGVVPGVWRGARAPDGKLTTFRCAT